MRFRNCVLAALLLTFTVARGGEHPPVDFNNHIMKTVKWLASNRAGLGYDLRSRYTSAFTYQDYTFTPTGNGKTMCVAAVYEVMMRSIESFRDESPENAAYALPAKTILEGSRATQMMPYIFQFKSAEVLKQYNRKFGAGAGDAFVLFGLGRYVTFDSAKAGDFIYMNRVRAQGGNGHAAIFIAYLDKTGQVVTNPKDAVGFRYFSAQGRGTNGLGYRDAFFDGICPKGKTQYVEDCGIIKSEQRSTLAVSRLDYPSNWFPQYSPLRIERFFSGTPIDTIYSEEMAFRQLAKGQENEIQAKARELAKAGRFPLLMTKQQALNRKAEADLESKQFTEAFGPQFE